MKKVFAIFGTRPEAIKMFPVIRELKRRGNYRCVVCVTAQHRQMLDQVLNVFSIKSDYDLDIMMDNQDLFDITQRCLAGLKDILVKETPDLVMVQGDTTTAFVAGLASYYLKIPVAHVEAGLRTYNKFSPFPEEKNRHILSVLSDYHFAPTSLSEDNLLKEGVEPNNIFVTGNTVVDALKFILERQKSTNSGLNIGQKLWKEYGIDSDGKIILVTGHRRENFGTGLKEICFALREIAARNESLQVVYPVHLNPNVKKPVCDILSNLPNIKLIPPLDYEEFVFLMSKSYVVLTDSGGIQEEAPFFGVPVLVMRDSTERPEGVIAGVSKVVGYNYDGIVKSVTNLVLDRKCHYAMSNAQSPYGDGLASVKIVNLLDARL